MKKKIDEATKELEASNLLRLMKEAGFDGNHASFASKAKRTRAELKQHLMRERPIPLSAVKAYANILKCSIRDISPRWADELIFGDAQISVEKPDKVATIKPKSKQESRIEEIVDLLRQTDMDGLAVVLNEAEKMATKYPLAKQTRESFQ